MSKPVLELKDINKFYLQAMQKINILEKTNFSLHYNEMVALLGPSGSGKTTALNIMGLLDSPSSGSVLINQEPVNQNNDKQKTLIRSKNIGFVFQFHNLLPDFTALENVMLPQLIIGESKAVAKERALKLIDMMQLSNRVSHYPSMLSGGEQQRIAIARALANKPSIVIADEPTGNLDEKIAEAVFEVFLNIVEEEKASVILASHDLKISDKIKRKVKISSHSIVTQS